MSIKWKIFLYIAIFSMVLLLLLWLFQVVFLDQFYRHVKIDQIEDTAHDIVRNIENDNIESYINNKVENSDYCIRIVDIDAQMTYTNESNKGVCGVMITSPSEINDLYQEALHNGGETLRTTNVGIYENFSEYSRFNPFIDNAYGSFLSEPAFVKTKDAFQTMTFGEIANVHSGNYFVMVNSRITLVDEISKTLQKQLVIITGIMALLALGMAFLISQYIAKPIIKINKGAKRLAKGEFDVHFEGKGYLEIEELNETLNYASKELSKVEKLRNELIANMSHDLRTPLTMISGYGEVMRDVPGENTPENVQIIIDESRRLSALVNDIMDLSKLQSGVQNLHKEVFSITKETQKIVTRFSKMLEKDGYEIIWEAKEECYVEADLIKINQVLYNLLVNATHYTGVDKKVVVRQRVCNQTVYIEVCDSGEGISEENLPYVWERYYKLDKVHKRSTIGSGLGLSIVRGVLELHHAEYGVQSRIGNGSVFYFGLSIYKQST